ncbi:MAG: Scr1 family TA system antitoxin-like transcriptional regulator [Streptosporangiaceae bacterium]
MTASAPPVRRRLVGKALRRYREGMGYTLDDVARMLECDRSKMSRIETGDRGIRGKELRELLAEYGIAGEQKAILELLADPRGKFGWYLDYEGVLRGAWRDYLTLETAASKISAYEAQRIPGLLQTPAYARALAETDPSLEDEAARDRAVGAVLARQRAILEEGGPEVRLIIGQAALHQQVGSAAVMDEQLSALARIAADSAAVTVQVLPFESGAHAAAAEGSLAILQFAGVAGLGLVHLGAISGGTCLEGQNDLVAYAGVFEQLRAFALDPARSALLLRGIAGVGPR